MGNMRVALASILAVCVLLGRYTLLAEGQSTQPDVTDAFKGEFYFNLARRTKPRQALVNHGRRTPKEIHEVVVRTSFTCPNTDGKPERIATFGYTDYKTCAVTDVPFKNIETCVLWVTKDVLADIPQNCVHGYEESCGIKLPAFDEETCGALLANA